MASAAPSKRVSSGGGGGSDAAATTAELKQAREEIKELIEKVS